LDSVGIGRVFLSRCDDDKHDGQDQPAAGTIFRDLLLDGEVAIFGTLKQTPQDFVVQEISHFVRRITTAGPAPNSTNETGHGQQDNDQNEQHVHEESTIKSPSFLEYVDYKRGSKRQDSENNCDPHKSTPERIVAEITDGNTLPTLPVALAASAQQQVQKEDAPTTSIATMKEEDHRPSNLTASTELHNSAASVTVSHVMSDDPEQHQASLQHFLEQAFHNTTNKDLPEKILNDLQHLQKNAREEVIKKGDVQLPMSMESPASVSPAPAAPVVWIPPFSCDTYSKTKRGEFHLLLRLGYTFLKSSVETREAYLQDTNNTQESVIAVALNTSEASASADNEKWIKVEVDDFFLPLVPWLAEPADMQLEQLYLFKNRGIIQEKANTNQNNHNPSQRNNTNTTSEQVSLQLHSKHANSKEARKAVHQMIARASRDFDTSTLTRDNDDGDGSSSTFIVVRWSRDAHRKSLKRKRKQISKQQQQQDNTNANGDAPTSYSNTSAGSEIYTLAVLQKTNLEHLACLQTLSRIVKCGFTDIGVAGIKDMYAVTSQFVTFRASGGNAVSPKRLRSQKLTLRKHGIELGNFEYTHSMLNVGNLSRNRFTIILRDLESSESQLIPISVIRSSEDDGSTTSNATTATPCLSRHVEQNVKRVQTLGFINFFGEQRVGDASQEQGGVRPFDIGRAMLQQDFLKAIDLIIQGRGAASESENVKKARALWQSSNRNADDVLKALPFNHRTFQRERAILKGAKRYGLDVNVDVNSVDEHGPRKVLQCLPHNIRTFYIHAYQSYTWNCAATKRIQLYGTQLVEGDLFAPNGDLSQVVLFNKKDQTIHHQNEGATFCNVVLPLPGYSVLYPTNEVGGLYQQMLENDGIEFKKDSVPEATAKGGYRFLQSHAHNLAWEPVPSVPVVQEGEGDGVAASDHNEDCAPLNDAKLTFELDAGCYATMMFRELLMTS
jgi:TruD family tRNA pseudouridine synthase